MVKHQILRMYHPVCLRDLFLPLLFLLFINDMAFQDVSCSIALFADDSKCFKQITTVNDCIDLQNDLNVLFLWSKKWQMAFNASKCKVLSITRSRSPIMYDYSMNHATLEHVGTFRDLGVIIDETLSFTPHTHDDL